MLFDDLSKKYRVNVTASKMEELLRDKPFLESYIGNPSDYPTDESSNMGEIALKNRLLEKPITLSDEDVEELQEHVVPKPYTKEDFGYVRGMLKSKVLVDEDADYQAMPIAKAIDNSMVKDTLGKSLVVNLYVSDKAREVSMEELFSESTLDKVAKCNDRAKEIVKSKTALQDELLYIKEMIVMNELYKTFEQIDN